MFLTFKKRITDRILHAAGFSIDYKWRPCLPNGPTNSAHMRTIVTTALQRQFLQTEFILWICIVIIFTVLRDFAYRFLWRMKQWLNIKLQFILFFLSLVIIEDKPLGAPAVTIPALFALGDSDCTVATPSLLLHAEQFCIGSGTFHCH
jgi:hypothetical protein